jgi:ABC-type multidrug transport system ATPase subunit
MGASGAGKSTLLNIISDRINPEKTSIMKRNVMINDTIPLTYSNFGEYGAYVMQEDILFMSFTPREALTFAARLKLTTPIKE